MSCLFCNIFLHCIDITAEMYISPVAFPFCVKLHFLLKWSYQLKWFLKVFHLFDMTFPVWFFLSQMCKNKCIFPIPDMFKYKHHTVYTNRRCALSERNRRFVVLCGHKASFQWPVPTTSCKVSLAEISQTSWYIFSGVFCCPVALTWKVNVTFTWLIEVRHTEGQSFLYDAKSLNCTG